MKHWTLRALTAALLIAARPGLALAQGPGEGGPGLFDVNLGLSLWTVVIFLLLLFVLGKFAWGPILDAAQQREANIRDALEEAARKHREAERLLEEHRAELNDARRQAQEIVAEGKQAGEKVRREIEETAREEGRSIVERARREIEREKEAALEAIRKESVDIAMAAAARLMRERLDTEKDRELVLQYVNRVTDGSGDVAAATGSAAASGTGRTGA